MSPQPSWRAKYRARAKSRGQYKNPGIYERTPEHRPPRMSNLTLKFWAVLASIGALVALIWLFFFSHTFAIEEVTIVGSVTPDVRATIHTIYGRNLLRYSATDLRTQLAASQSSVRELEIFKGLPDTLRIDIALRDPVAVWERDGTTYFLDATGVLFDLNPDVADSVAASLVRIRDTQLQPVTPGAQLVGESFVAFVIQLADSFPSKFPLKIERIELAETTFEVTVVTDAGWRAQLDTTRQLEPQLAALQKIFERFHDQITEYVDLRIPERAYFK